MPVEDVSAFEVHVDRILDSEEMRDCQVLCRLFRYLAEKTANGEADRLKEYTVAVEGLGRAATYDPRMNSTIRIQAARLRQKLAEYYRNEGKNDEVVIELPRGHFKLTWIYRAPVKASWSERGPTENNEYAYASLGIPASPNQSERLSGRTWILSLITLTAVLAAGYFAFELYQLKLRQSATLWDQAVEELWQPIVSSRHATILVIEDPLFVQFRNGDGMFYRDRSLNQWSDVPKSSQVVALQNTLSDKGIQTSRYYTAFGEVDASNLLTRLLSSRIPAMPIVKSSQLSWRQLADNNILFVGVQNLFFDEKLQGLPLLPQLVPSTEGVRNLHPEPGEQPLYTDSFKTYPSQSGEVYALVTHVPGPVGSHEIESFTSNRSAGYVAAIQAFTDAHSASMIEGKLRQAAHGKMPRYYQVLFRVNFKDDVPTGIAVVLSRELR